MKKLLIVPLLGIFLFTLSACGATTELVHNPYENVDFSTTTNARAALHNHSTHSDGSDMPHEVVDVYHELGFDVLAITDHDYQTSRHSVTYPWDEFSELNEAWEDRDSNALEMMSIPGSEFSRAHHTVGLFTEHLPHEDDDEWDYFEALEQEEDALGWLAHPGRYWSWMDEDHGDEFSETWYASLFEDFDQEILIGMEVFSQRDRFEYDRNLWDDMLTRFMPERPIYGTSVDDYHGSYAGYSFQDHPMQDPLDADEFRASLLDGAFFSVSRHDTEDSVPIVNDIIVDEESRTITIEAENYDLIRWISGLDDDNLSKEVATGETFDYGRFDGNYVRAEILINPDSNFRRKIIVQPFGFAQID